MNLLKKLPYPIAGTALGLAALGNLLSADAPWLKPILGAIAAVLILMILAKISLLPKSVTEASANPLIASTFATFPMALMILSTYLPKGPMALALWAVGLLFHAGYIVWFTWRYLLKGFRLQTVFPSWFIVYVGIAAASVSAPYHSQTALGMIAFWFAFATYLPLLVLVTWRMIKADPLAKPALPAIAIYAAPASLLLAGYLNSAAVKSQGMVLFLLALSILFFLVGMAVLVKFSALPFFPSFSSYTFPFVISAIAAKGANAFLTKAGQSYAWLGLLTRIQPTLALLLCAYVLIRYLLFLWESPAFESVPSKR
ncbi:TDT family transporter [Proteiniclasticum sp. QWL-01]|uniref:TDT family transporter n=1 Tax=Proteiniclasticum sp. QWL-01 TaxID=3036945 RepID=UPI002410296B|nr:TDT family transporter [Proteiniclasticum sp. QWL-01]WFF72129.1 TDT family transporter [Proteiniclasticum sp. QWL-01]